MQLLPESLLQNDVPSDFPSSAVQADRRRPLPAAMMHTLPPLQLGLEGHPDPVLAPAG